MSSVSCSRSSSCCTCLPYTQHTAAHPAAAHVCRIHNTRGSQPLIQMLHTSAVYTTPGDHSRSSSCCTCLPYTTHIRSSSCCTCLPYTQHTVAHPAVAHVCRIHNTRGSQPLIQLLHMSAVHTTHSRSSSCCTCLPYTQHTVAHPAVAHVCRIHNTRGSQPLIQLLHMSAVHTTPGDHSRSSSCCTCLPYTQHTAAHPAAAHVCRTHNTRGSQPLIQLLHMSAVYTTPGDHNCSSSCCTCLPYTQHTAAHPAAAHVCRIHNTSRSQPLIQLLHMSAVHTTPGDHSRSSSCCTYLPYTQHQGITAAHPAAAHVCRIHNTRGSQPLIQLLHMSAVYTTPGDHNRSSRCCTCLPYTQHQGITTAHPAAAHVCRIQNTRGSQPLIQPLHMSAVYTTPGDHSRSSSCCTCLPYTQYQGITAAHPAAAHICRIHNTRGSQPLIQLLHMSAVYTTPGDHSRSSSCCTCLPYTQHQGITAAHPAAAHVCSIHNTRGSQPLIQPLHMSAVHTTPGDHSRSSSCCTCLPYTQHQGITAAHPAPAHVCRIHNTRGSQPLIQPLHMSAVYTTPGDHSRSSSCCTCLPYTQHTAAHPAAAHVCRIHNTQPLIQLLHMSVVYTTPGDHSRSSSCCTCLPHTQHTAAHPAAAHVCRTQHQGITAAHPAATYVCVYTIHNTRGSQPLIQLLHMAAVYTIPGDHSRSSSCCACLPHTTHSRSSSCCTCLPYTTHSRSSSCCTCLPYTRHQKLSVSGVSGVTVHDCHHRQTSAVAKPAALVYIQLLRSLKLREREAHTTY